MKTLPPRLRLMLMLPAIAALVCGVLSGLARLGLPVPDAIARLIGVHGALMIGGFFGTVISLERAVALGVRWPYLAPLFSGLAAIALIAAAPLPWSALLLSLAALVMCAACAGVWRRQRVAHHAVLTIAALMWLAGNLLWALTGTVTPAVPLWAAFLLLTIAGERLELSRFLPTPPVARSLFAITVAAVLAGALGALINEAAGLVLFAAALLALAAWLLRYDIVRHTIRTAVLTRYMAVCLLTGYLWLAIAALFGLAGALQAGSPLRDAALHALLLGFVFSMVFGHAPIILPAVTRLNFNWHRGFYIPLAVLHLGLAARVAAGLGGWFALRQYAAIANALALVLFMVLVVTSLSRHRRSGAVQVAGRSRVAAGPTGRRSLP
ncbi:MAG: hypothetical protein ABI790_15095 [Betaproteobacteria bacterium]